MTLMLNTNLKMQNATTQYTGIDINSCVKAYGDYYASTESGLYQLGGSTEEVDAYFIISTVDFGLGNDKRLRYVYLSLETTGDLQLDINTEKVATETYTLSITSVGQQDIRIPINRSLYGRFWTFKISNIISKADFSIDQIQVLPVVRNRSY